MKDADEKNVAYLSGEITSILLGKDNEEAPSKSEEDK